METVKESLTVERVRKPYKLRSDIGKKRGTRKGSQADWLLSFAIGETRWIEAQQKGKNWRNHPPPSKSRRGIGDAKFQCVLHCAVPQSSLAVDPVYVWKITRLA